MKKRCRDFGRLIVFRRGVRRKRGSRAELEHCEVIASKNGEKKQEGQ